MYFFKGTLDVLTAIRVSEQAYVQTSPGRCRQDSNDLATSSNVAERNVAYSVPRGLSLFIEGRSLIPGKFSNFICLLITKKCHLLKLKTLISFHPCKKLKCCEVFLIHFVIDCQLSTGQFIKIPTILFEKW